MVGDAATKKVVNKSLKRLEELYAQLYSTDFSIEKQVYLDLLPRLIKKLKDSGLDLIEPVGLGSTATVWIVQDRPLGLKRALKLPRPRLAKLKDILRIVRSERERLASLNHQNIIKIYAADDIELTAKGEEYSFPYFVMEYLDHVKDLDDYVLENRASLTGIEIIELFRDVLTGISFLHNNKIIHCDIKPGNLLIAPGRPALVADLGYAKHLPKLLTDTQPTEVHYTPRYAHPDLKQKMLKTSDPQANVSELPRDQMTPKLDLFSFGRSMQEVLEKLRVAEERDKRSVPIFTNYQWRYLGLISKRLLDGQVENVNKSDLLDDIISGLTAREMRELKYPNAVAALEDFEKLLNLYDLEGQVPELNPNLNSYIQIPHCRVPLTKRVRAIIDHPAFARLANVTQLGFVSTVYPGASHSRFEHMLGTFTNACEYVRALWYEQSNCFFQCTMTRRDIEIGLLAALVHDIAQYPMAHDLSEVAAEFEHEPLAEAVLRRLYAGSDETLQDVIESEWRVAIDEVLAILRLTAQATIRHRILHSVISGPLDCDKLDYIRRDSTHLGVPFGAAVDEQRLLRNLTVVYSSHTVEGALQLDVAEIGVTAKALVVAKSVLHARSEMFTQVYWQHTVRGLKTMLGYAVRRILITVNEDKQEQFWADFQDHIFAAQPCYCVAEPPYSAPVTSGQAGPHTEASQVTNDFTTEPVAFSALSSHLFPTDDALLVFLSKYADANAKRVLKAIRERELYRRVAVLSGERSGEVEADKTKYEIIYERFRTYRLDKNYLELEKLRKHWQDGLLGKLKAKVTAETDVGGGRTFAQVEGDLTSIDPLILVDVPMKATSRSTGRPSALRYLAEDSSDMYGISQGFSLPQFDVSKVDLDQQVFDRDVGKIRIFVYPKYRNLFANSLSRTEMIDVLTS